MSTLAIVAREDVSPFRDFMNHFNYPTVGDVGREIHPIFLMVASYMRLQDIIGFTSACSKTRVLLREHVLTGL